MNHPPTFELFPATREDIPRLSHIHVIACLPDNAFKLYFPTAAEFDKRVTEMLEGQVGDPTWQHIKAVDKKTGVLAAWASWNTLADAEIRERDEKAAAKRSADAEKGKLGKGEFDFPPGLPMFVQADTDKWLERWTRGRRHVQCKALFTDPSFQGQGMGNALVEYGNQLADEAGLPIFLQASPYGFPIYEKHGFETVQYLDVDLREWAKGARSGDKGFGNYRFRYMSAADQGKKLSQLELISHVLFRAASPLPPSAQPQHVPLSPNAQGYIYSNKQMRLRPKSTDIQNLNWTPNRDPGVGTNLDSSETKAIEKTIEVLCGDIDVRA